MSAMRLSLLLGLAACGGDSSTDDTSKTDDSGNSSETRDFSTFVNTTTPYTAGDLTCTTETPAAPDATCQVDQTLDGEVKDFQTSEGVPGESVKFYFSDDVSTTADIAVTADDNGQFEATVPVCTPIGYYTVDDYGDTVPTYEVHQIFDHEDGGVLSETVNSVSDATANIIPSIIGVAWDKSSTGIIAGTAFDCNEDPIGHAQIFIHDADGNLPETGTVYYFDDNELPTDLESQPDSNVDNGLWVAINIPAGTWIVEQWGYDGTDYVNLGATTLTTKAGSVNISNIYAGHTDGIRYPDSCLSPCE